MHILKALDASSRRSYFGTWTKYLMMIFRCVLAERGDNRFLEFGERCLTPELRSLVEKAVAEIETSLEEGEGDDFIIMKVLHPFFVVVVGLKNPTGLGRHLSTGTLFMAFSQLKEEGEWKQVALVTQAPARLRYAFRCIIFFEIMLREGSVAGTFSQDASELWEELMDDFEEGSDSDLEEDY